MARRRRAVRGASITTLAAVAASCGAPPRPAVIGCVLPPWSAPVVRVVADELARAPDSGTIHLACDTTDSGALEEEDQALAQQLVTLPRLVGVVGHLGSRSALLAAPVYREAEVVQLVPTGTSRALAEAGPWTFALPPNDSIEGRFIADVITDSLDAASATVIYANDNYGAGLADGVATALGARGIPVLGVIPLGPTSSVDTIVRAELSVRRPGAIVSAAQPTLTAEIVQAVRRAGSRVPIVAGDGALMLPNFAQTLGGAEAGLSVVTFWTPAADDSVSRDFITRFRDAAHTEPGAADALIYDGLRLMVAAVRHAGPSSRAVRAYLATLGHVAPPYVGVTGPIAFPANGDRRLMLVHFAHGTLRPGRAP